MKPNILELVLQDLLQYYLSLDEEEVDKLLMLPGVKAKERITTADDLQVIIYFNDHSPPHFNVKTRDHRIDAKFKIENCELLGSSIGTKDLKKIQAFYLSAKGKMVLEAIWQKTQNQG